MEVWSSYAGMSWLEGKTAKESLDEVKQKFIPAYKVHPVREFLHTSVIVLSDPWPPLHTFVWRSLMPRLQ